MSKQSSFALGAIVFIVFGFQNCSQKLSSNSGVNSASSQNESVIESASSPEDQPINEPNQNGGQSEGSPVSGSQPALINHQDCYFNYVTIFKWENYNLSNSFDVAPVLSQQKIATIKIFNSTQVNNTTLKSSLDFTSDTEWKYYFILSAGTTVGSTTVTSYLNKKNQLDGSTELTCGFGPVFDANFNITDPSARIVYQNVGVGLNGIDGQGGFLSHQDKFIACKFSKGSQGVRFHGQNSQVNVNQAFVVKRGCYQ